MFDLEAAVSDFKSQMGTAGPCSASDVAELESHLRDSVGRLTAAGLSTEEAFLIAARRLGRPESLAAEYAAAHPDRVWRERAMWMLAGLIAWGAISTLSELIPAVGFTLAALFDVSERVVGRISLALGLLGVAASVLAAVILYRYVSRRSTRLSPARWVVLGIATILLGRAFGVAGNVFALHHFKPAEFASGQLWKNYAMFGFGLLFPIAYGVVLLHLRRKSESC